MADTKNHGIVLPALVALVISSAIGAGIFDLPATLAQGATPGAAILAWVITGFGILMLALSLNNLVLNKPELTGVSDYVRAGFGDFAGFISGWGYWLSAWLGNVAFATMLMSALGYFFPALKSGNRVPAIVLASLVSWALTLLVTRGIESAAAINTIVTITKLVPIFAFVVVAILSIKAGVFTAHFWQNMSTNVGGKLVFSSATTAGIAEQIKNCVMAMMWVFVGIEGATMMAARAKKKSDAGKATIIGLIISILGAWLSWTMLPVEATSLMAEQGLLPEWFGVLNKYRAPQHSLLLTQVLIQIFLITLLFTDEAYNFAYSLCTAAIVVCYVLVGAYQLKLGLQLKKLSVILPGLIAVIFEVTAIVFSGMQYLWLCTILYVLGFMLYVRARREVQQAISKTELVMMGVVVVLALAAIMALATGNLKI